MTKCEVMNLTSLRTYFSNIKHTLILVHKECQGLKFQKETVQPRQQQGMMRCMKIRKNSRNVRPTPAHPFNKQYTEKLTMYKNLEKTETYSGNSGNFPIQSKITIFLSYNFCVHYGRKLTELGTRLRENFFRDLQQIPSVI